MRLFSNRAKRNRKQARLRRLKVRASKLNITVAEYLTTKAYTKEYPIKTTEEVWSQMLSGNYE